MPDDTTPKGNVSRRGFLQGAAALGLTLASARPVLADEKWDDEADVVIVGFGAAGASAAIEARAAGASVLVLERAETGGGTSAMAGGIIYYGGGTALQKALGYDDDAEQMFRYLMASSGPVPDEEKIRLYCSRSVEHYDWTVRQGVRFKESFYKGISLPLTDDGLLYSGSEKAFPYNNVAKPAPRGHKPQVEGDGGGALLMKHLIASARTAGARVATGVLCETLIRDSDGRVVGVQAKVGSESRRFRARRGLVLAAGGFCRNREMVARYAPLYMDCDTPIGVAGDDGRGILMGMEAGGAAMRMDACFCAMPFHPPDTVIQGIIVNAQGRRFINEDSYYGRTGEAILRWQGGRAFLVLDSGCHDDPAYARGKMVGEADTIASLEASMSMADGALQDTVRLYNRFAADKLDPLQHKAPQYLRPLDQAPYRALDISTDVAYYPFFTLGGLHTRSSGEVVAPRGDSVPGLFAAGRTTSGLAALGYSSGVALADATFFGRMAGQHAAKA